MKEVFLKLQDRWVVTQALLLKLPKIKSVRVAYGYCMKQGVYAV